LTTTILTGSSPSHHFLHTFLALCENIKQGIRYSTRFTIQDRFQPYRYRRNINSNASILLCTSNINIYQNTLNNFGDETGEIRAGTTAHPST